MSRVRLVPLIFVMLLTLSVLFGGWQAYYHFKLVGPLQTQLDSIQGVTTVDVVAGNPGRIKVHLGPVKTLVNQDLQSTYLKIMSTVSGSFSGSDSVTLLDNRNQELQSAYENLFPIVAEGVSKGNYTEMISQVENQAAKQGITARITMDEHNIYIQFSKGSHYLYDVYPYTLRPGGGAAS
ncbi:hypothetical protein LLE49_03465 [Alicyclobacillus tolerans]|uniref:hypothetical protein n=1 Tax=Alicyclobacillus tolerans TaxID=90970 RepID=UPI001F2D186D|nr:hypothetical protein [Alicyclobacillus tolerans]MCF8563797.1 hypothetical protein [Alicyclobacillus tolerans]